MTEIEEIQNIVDGLIFREDDYKPGKFDCVQMSVLVFDGLENAGYHPEFIAGWKSLKGRGHVWIEVDNLDVECTWKVVKPRENFLKFKTNQRRFSTKSDLEKFVIHEQIRVRIRNPWLGADKLKRIKIEWLKSEEHFCISRKGLDQEVFKITEGGKRIIGNIEGNIIDIKVPMRFRPLLSLIRIYYNKRKAYGMFPLQQRVINWKNFGLVSFDPKRVVLNNRHIIFNGDYSSWDFKVTKRDFDKLSKISLLDAEKSSV